MRRLREWKSADNLIVMISNEKKCFPFIRKVYRKLISVSIYSRLQLHFSMMQAFTLISLESDYEPTFHSFLESTRKLFVKHSNSHIFRCILKVSCAVMSYLELTLISDKLCGIWKTNIKDLFVCTLDKCIVIICP